VEIVYSKPIRINGEDLVESLQFLDKTINVSGIFLLRKAMPPDQLIYGLELTEDGHIKVDKEMKTSIDGLFACGDCTGKPYQVAKAVGEGQIAAFSSKSKR